MLFVAGAGVRDLPMNARALAMVVVAAVAAAGDDTPKIASNVAPVERAEFEKLERELIPTRDAAWETIGWRVDLLAARAEAIRSGKPLFLWAMNGHPLGGV